MQSECIHITLHETQIQMNQRHEHKVRSIDPDGRESGEEF